MGSCFSSDSFPTGAGGKNSTAKVVFPDGSLREFACAVPASVVLISADHHDDDDSSSHFICSSDELFYDVEIQALDLRQALQLGQLYFVLPRSKLGRRLSGVDMAAMAVKASSAMAAAAAAVGNRKDDQKSTVQVMPVSFDCDSDNVLGGINVLTTIRLDLSTANSLRCKLASETTS